jgi:hypothetical protein
MLDEHAVIARRRDAGETDTESRCFPVVLDMPEDPASRRGVQTGQAGPGDCAKVVIVLVKCAYACG